MPKIILIYLIYGLSFFSMGVAILARLPLTTSLPQAHLFAGIGLFGLLHGIMEWLIAIRYLSDWPDGVLKVGIHFMGATSFSVLLFVPLARFFIVKRGFAVLTTAIIITVFSAVLWWLKSLPAGLETFEILYRWLLGVPAVSGTATALFLESRNTVHDRATRRGWLAGASFFIFYAILTSFTDPSSIFPGSTWNTAHFLKLVGIPVPVLRSLCSLGIMVSIIFAQQRMQAKFAATMQSQLQEQLERTLRNERMLSTLMINIPGMVYRCMNDQHWTMLYVSDGCLALTGYHPRRFLSGEILFNQIIHPEDRSMVRQVVENNLRRNKPFEITYRIFDSTGQEKWVWEHGQAVFSPEIGMQVLEGFISDITTVRQAQLSLEASEQKYRQLVELAQAGVWSVDAYGYTDYVNRRMANMLGLHPRQIIGRKFAEFVRNNTQLRDWSLHEEWLQGEKFHRVEYELKTMSGQPVFALFEVAPLYDKNGRYTGAIAFVLDITDQKQNEQKLTYLADHDPLTGFYNRHYLFEQLRQLQEMQNPPQCALLFIDFDRFKQINDIFGHHVGDILLREAAARMMSLLRSEDILARMGGDEFAILLRSQTSPRAVAAFANRLVELFRQEFRVDTEKIYCSISIGIAFFPQDGENVVQLIKNANRAMYWSKQTGKNNFQFFSPEMSRDSEERHYIESELRKNIEQNTLEVFYQPQVDVKTWNVRGLEALCRLKDSNTGKYISPDRFIPIAEESGLINHMGRQVIEKALADLKKLHQAGFQDLTMAVNLSPRQLQSGRLVEDLKLVMSHAGINPQLLELEITESAAMSNPESGEKILQDIRATGIRLAIDDFGTGYSSLAYLQRFPVEHLKIDRIFVRDLPENLDNATIVRSMINLGHSLNMTITAEGVETLEQMRFLRDSGCDIAQGFYFSPALSLDKLLAFLQNGVSAQG